MKPRRIRILQQAAKNPVVLFPFVTDDADAKERVEAVRRATARICGTRINAVGWQVR